MKTQTSVHLKLDNELKERLDCLCEERGLKRNEVLNRAVARWLRLESMQRQYELESIMGTDDKKAFCDGVLRYWWPELPEFLRWPSLKR